MLKNFMHRIGWISGVLAAGVAVAAPGTWRVTDPELSAALEARGARMVADYGSFQILQADSIAPAAPVEAKDEFNFIELRAGILNTRTPEAQALRKPAGNFTGKRLHLVQFDGPIKPEWVSAMEQCGVERVSYIPQNAYLVAGDAAALARLQAWSHTDSSVQWEGDYAPEYKLTAPTANASIAGRYVVQLLADTNANLATLALIRRLSVSSERSTFHVLRFLDVTAELPGNGLAQIASQPDVVFIQPAGLPEKLDERQDQILAGNLSGNLPSGAGYLAWLSGKGFSQTQFDSSGFVVDLSDSGIDNGTTNPGHFGLYTLGNPGLASRIAYNRLEGTITNEGSTLQGCDGHGNLNAHIIGGYCAYTGFPYADSSGYEYGLGVCPFVRIGSSVVFDPDTFTFPNYANLQSDAYQSGARISANSWGKSAIGTNDYDSDSQAYDALVRDAQPDGSTYASSNNQQMVILFAAGNGGPTARTISIPGTAKNVITVGSSENVRSLSTANGGADSLGDSGCPSDPDSAASSANDMSASSSRGPCLDGRIKPDLVAPGTHITGGVAQSATATNGTGSAISCYDAESVCALPGSGGQGNPDNFFPLSQQFYTVSSGTSLATPAVAGACALLRQYFTNNAWSSAPSPAMTKAYLMNSARYLNGVGANDTLWSASQGMGELNLGTAFDGVPRILRDQVTADKFTATGQTRSFTGTISDPSKPFRVTLAWTDAPGSPAAAKALVNDLDLTVTTGGVTYKGNVFSGAFSVPGGAADSLNNVESVLLPAGVSGTFLVTITAANISGDGVPNEAPSLDQDFALVIYNATQSFVPVLSLESTALTFEACSPTNNSIDPGETVGMSFSLKNVGTVNTTNLVATLLQTNGVAMPSGPQTYGTLVAGGPAVTQAFSFTAGGICGGSVQPVLQFQDGATSLGAAAATFQLGAVVISTAAPGNPANIQVPQSGSVGPASPYPSTVTVSGVTGIVNRVTVTLSGLTHGNVSDVDALLVGPTGTNVLLMSYCGQYNGVSGVNLTFDDSAASALPQFGQIVSGTFQPTPEFGESDTFPGSAPSAPFGQTLSVFNGLNPNGTWALYVQDNSTYYAGYIANGWQLSITASNLVCCSGSIPPAPDILSIALSGTNATMTWTAVPGQSYRLQYSTNLSSSSNWVNVPPDVLATNFTAALSTATNSAKGFYRVQALH